MTAPAELRPVGTGTNKPNGPVVAHVDLASGDRHLSSFVPTGNTMYVTFSCLGEGAIKVGSLFDYSPCDGVSATVAVHGQRGLRQDLLVTANSATGWRLLISSGR
jgi:hypothetical protein